jgi:hypothetical protein
MRLSGTPNGLYLRPKGLAPVCIAATTPPRLFAWRWKHCDHLPDGMPAYCMPYVTREYGGRMEAYLPQDEEDQ